MSSSNDREIPTGTAAIIAAIIGAGAVIAAAVIGVVFGKVEINLGGTPTPPQGAVVVVTATKSPNDSSAPQSTYTSYPPNPTYTLYPTFTPRIVVATQVPTLVISTAEPTGLPKKLVVKQATASSSIPYSDPASAFDCRISCEYINPNEPLLYCWVSSAGDIQGAWIEATLESPKTVTGLNFYGSNIREGRVIFDDGSSQKILLKKIPDWQLVELQPVVTSRVRIIIDKIYDDSTNVLIPELEVWGR